PLEPAGGTTGARWYQGPDGQRYVVKRYDGDADRVVAEALANTFLRAIGKPAPETIVTLIDGRRVLVTKKVDGHVVPGHWGGPQVEAMRSQFVAQAFIANDDVLSLIQDNVVHDSWGNSTPVDQGAS